MNTCNSRVLLKTNDRETTLFVTDMTKANVVVPKLIKWDEVELPTAWQLEKATPTQTSIMIQSEFQIDKEALRKDFASEENQPQRYWILKNYQGPKRIQIQEIYYNFLNHVKLNIPFLDWFHAYTIKKNIDYPFRDDLIGQYSTNVVWHLKDGEKVQSELPPKTQYQLPQIRDDKNNHVLVAPFKTKDVDENLTPKDIKSLMEQVNYTNKYLQVLALDLAIEDKDLNNSSFNANNVYEWNIDGKSEYNIMHMLQHMTMVCTDYQTAHESSKEAIANIIVSRFTRQLKGIFSAVKIDDNGEPIFNNGETIPDAVNTLIFTIAQHFIGDPSLWKDRSAELLSNLKCKTLGYFKWYKDTFLTRVFTREDSQQPFWKEKFLVGLPRSLGDKVRDKIRSLTPDNIIPYDHLSYGQLISFVQKTALEICQNDKLQRQLAKEKTQNRKELDTFCEQFGLPRCSKQKNKKKYKQQRRFRNPKRRNQASIGEPKTESKPPPGKKKSIVCYNCKKPGHINKYCRLKRRISNLNLEPELEEQISSLLVATSEEESTDDYSDEDIHNIQQNDEVSSSDSSDAPTINVLPKEQDLFFEAINYIPDPEEKRNFLNKLKQTLEKQPRNSVVTNNILSQLQDDSNQEKPFSEPNLEHNEVDWSDFLGLINRLTIQSFFINIKIIVEDFVLETIALFDTGANSNCILEGLIPTKYFEKTSEKLSTANGSKLHIRYKLSKATIENQGQQIPSKSPCRLKKNPPSWSKDHTTSVKHVKQLVKNLPCLSLPIPQAFKIVETDASDLGYGGILKQKLVEVEHIVAYTSKHWNPAQQNYSTVKKEVLAIVLCVSKFQSDLLNQKFLIRVDFKSAKEILQKDDKNLASKQIFAR
uniref:Enzymatic polyprotein n=1 Tax=Cajanus cajan TaxID=3821 RepID=A0A151QPZ5_CAJCA|nr:Enzymatic polyprotein [Cajanus cajan]